MEELLYMDTKTKGQAVSESTMELGFFPGKKWTGHFATKYLMRCMGFQVCNYPSLLRTIRCPLCERERERERLELFDLRKQAIDRRRS